MLEAEVKIPLSGGATALLARLRGAGATDRGHVEQRDTYFVHPSRDLRATDEALRLRQEPGRVLLTYKGPKLDARTKTREELEVEIRDAETMRRLLDRLGFRAIGTVRKRRRRLSWKGLTVAVDTVPGLGTFVEIEMPGGRSVRRARARLFAAARALELPVESQIRRSYLELLAHRREVRRRHLRPRRRRGP